MCSYVCVCVCGRGWSENHSVVSDSLRPHGLYMWPHGLYSPWNSPGKHTGVDTISLFQGVFPTQESNPGFLHCRWILYQLSHKGSTRILEWVAYLFSRGSSQPRNRNRVSCIAGGFFFLPTELWGKTVEVRVITQLFKHIYSIIKSLWNWCLN